MLLLLDEFAALDRLKPALQAAGLMAGLGLQLWPILQDLAQLRAAYGESASTFLANAGLLQVAAPADLDTAQWAYWQHLCETLRLSPSDAIRAGGGGQLTTMTSLS